MLAGLVVVAFVMAGLLDDDDPAGVPQPADRTVLVPQLGLAFVHPGSWPRQIDRRVIRIRSPEGSVTMTFSSPTAGREPARVRTALERGLRRSLEGDRLVADGPGMLGGRDVTSFEMAGRNQADGPVRALGIVESTPFRTYAVTVITPAQPSRVRLREVQEILASVRFSEPGDRPGSSRGRGG